MNEKWPLFGYGYSLEGRQGAWEELEAVLPTRGPNCPPTLDWIDLVLEQPTSKESDLHAHRAGCAYCQARFAALQRAAARMEEVRAGAGQPTLAQVGRDLASRRAAVRRGKVIFLKGAAGGPGEEVNARVFLPPAADQEGIGPLHVYLHWSRASLHEGEPWCLSLQLFSSRSHQDYGNADVDLEQLRGRRLELNLLGDRESQHWPFETVLRMTPDGSQLVSYPLRVDAPTPRAVASLELLPGAASQAPAPS